MGTPPALISPPAAPTRILGDMADTNPAAGPVLDRTAVAELLGRQPKTISQFLVESKPGGRYADAPFPAPDGYIGRGPYWVASRADEITAWDAARPGRGVRRQPATG